MSEDHNNVVVIRIQSSPSQSHWSMVTWSGQRIGLNHSLMSREYKGVPRVPVLQKCLDCESDCQPCWGRLSWCLQLNCYSPSRAAAREIAVYSLQSTVYSLQSTVYSLQSTVYSLQSTVYSLQSTVYSLQFTVYCLQSTVYSLQSTVYSTV